MRLFAVIPIGGSRKGVTEGYAACRWKRLATFWQSHRLKERLGLPRKGLRNAWYVSAVSVECFWFYMARKTSGTLSNQVEFHMQRNSDALFPTSWGPKAKGIGPHLRKIQAMLVVLHFCPVTRHRVSDSSRQSQQENRTCVAMCWGRGGWRSFLVGVSQCQDLPVRRLNPARL